MKNSNLAIGVFFSGNDLLKGLHGVWFAMKSSKKNHILYIPNVTQKIFQITHLISIKMFTPC